MKTILAIAKNTFRETLRDKILYTILGFALVFIISDIFFAAIANNDTAMVKSFGLAAIYLFGTVITIFLASSIIYKEIERRTLYFVLSKPVSRAHVILGKFAGLLAAIVLTILLMTVVYLAVVLVSGAGFDYMALVAVFFQLLEAGLFIAILVFFSSFLAPLPSILSATMLLFVGHMLPTALANIKVIGGPLYGFAKGAYYILPNLEKFNVRNLVVHDLGVSSSVLFVTVAYGVLYSSLLLIAAVYIFKKREL
ncbi:MAG: hypothetical protein COU11_01725 [Candidatus Harrisonbacteria bacterium CG10_big_fil_rev_8_21_14_0_10_49_15]|uniref:ABC transporter permease n=1 Tax=Candidatus Harrisonbacteria bacterium CG10_big_fil_rev_8_21_14_0_10_49_15 TaxID=1974587 RepID=A0A2H0UL99_9BACT|nr:MAG: hypothetical protein COU11_01725 [Candidatus Harrisonbacteria bacterium CG10_big_fil_rev_8_21_14_0_10_49_15]